MAVYVDTSALISLREPREKNHRAAQATFARLLKEKHVLIVGRHTLIELADGLARHYDQATAASDISRLVQSQIIRIEDSEPHWSAAMDILCTRTDWNVDLSDCLSFALMESIGVHHAFTFDHDFEKAGFKVVA